MYLTETKVILGRLRRQHAEDVEREGMIYNFSDVRKRSVTDYDIETLEALVKSQLKGMLEMATSSQIGKVKRSIQVKKAIINGHTSSVSCEMSHQIDDCNNMLYISDQECDMKTDRLYPPP